MIRKIFFWTLFVLILGYLFLEIKFLITEKYSTAFIDYLGANMTIIQFVLFGLLINIGLKIIKRNKKNIIFILIFSFLLLTCSFLTRKSLAISNKILYRKDLGLQAFYLYIDEFDKKYILIYTYPFGKSTLIGKYSMKDSIIYFGNNIYSEFNMSECQVDVDMNSIDINSMTKIK